MTEPTLEQILAAKVPTDVFGDPPAGEDTETWFRVRHRDISKLFHPDLNPHPRAGEAQKKLNELYEKAKQAEKDVLISTRDAEYSFSPILFEVGDLCDVFLGTRLKGGKTEEAVFKVAHSADNSDLLAREQKVLEEMWSHVEAESLEFFGYTIPRPFGGLRLSDSRPISVLKRHQGVTAADIRKRFPNGIPPEQVAWMLTRLLTTIAMAHKYGQLHGSVLPEHLLVRWDNAKKHRHAKILDWTASVPLGEKLKVFFPDHILFYPPEAFNKHEVTPATDLYMFGQTANYLLGGDLKNRRVPDHVPGPLRGAIQACLIPSTNRRPDDCGRFLTDVLRPALAEVWGSPKYMDFNLPEISSGETPPS